MSIKHIHTVYVLLIFLGQYSNAQGVSENSNLGFVSEMVLIKNTSENYLANYLASRQYPKDARDISIAKGLYVQLKTSVDRLLLQLSADMIEKNYVAKYRRINKFFKSNTLQKSDESRFPASLKAFRIQFQKIESDYKALLEVIHPEIVTIHFSENKAEGIAPTDIVSVILDGVDKIAGIITKAAELRASKIEALNKILDALRLAPLKDLVDEKKEAGKKPDDKPAEKEK